MLKASPTSPLPSPPPGAERERKAAQRASPSTPRAARRGRASRRHVRRRAGERTSRKDPSGRSGLGRQAVGRALCRRLRRDRGRCGSARSGASGHDAGLPRQDRPPSPHTRRIDRSGPRWLWTPRSSARSPAGQASYPPLCPSSRGVAPRVLRTPTRGGALAASPILRRRRAGWRTRTSRLSIMRGTQKKGAARRPPPCNVQSRKRGLSPCGRRKPRRSSRPPCHYPYPRSW